MCMLWVALIAISNVSIAQNTVERCEHWLATVDESSQRIVISWQPSPTPQTMGYHICTGTPCVDYDTVFGRLDTQYICIDHSPLETHTYRLHVFDSTYNVSALTPPFGNMVLQVEIPLCSPEAKAGWTAYKAMPGGLKEYRLMARCEPQDSAFRLVYSTLDTSVQNFVFPLPEGTVAVNMKVQALGLDGMMSQSNIVRVEKTVPGIPSQARLTDVYYDSVLSAVRVEMAVDTGFYYTLQRFSPNGIWEEMDSFHATDSLVSIIDNTFIPDNGLLCYRLVATDLCGENQLITDSVCAHLPAVGSWVAMPNVLLPGDDGNDCLCPHVNGLRGDLYELVVYNRAGVPVYQTVSPDNCWCPDPYLPQGTYVYSLRCRLLTGDMLIYNGSITLIK